MIDAFTLPETEEEDIDIYDELGLNTPVSTDTDQATTQTYDPLAAFMDDDDEEEEETVPDMFAY